MSSDPETQKIQKLCVNLIGCIIKLSFTMTLSNGEIISGVMDNCNIVGDCMEDFIYPYIRKHIPTFKKGPKQASPDFYNSKWEWELKCFGDSPGFDISNFRSYISQLEDNLERKLYTTQYLIFKYVLDDGNITITDFKLCNVWEIINYTGKYPISLQSKKNVWHNIRPCSFNAMNSKDKSAFIFIKKICEAIDKCPNNIEDKSKIISNIRRQYYQLEYNKVLTDLPIN